MRRNNKHNRQFRFPRIAVSHMLDKLFCKHTNVMFDDKQTLVCEKCGITWPISNCLVHASGVYARIEQRLEQTEELTRLVELAEQYQKDNNFVREMLP